MQIHRYIIDHQGIKTPISQKGLAQLHITNPTLDAIFRDVYTKTAFTK